MSVLLNQCSIKGRERGLTDTGSGARSKRLLDSFVLGAQGLVQSRGGNSQDVHEEVGGRTKLATEQEKFTPKSTYVYIVQRL